MPTFSQYTILNVFLLVLAVGLGFAWKTDQVRRAAVNEQLKLENRGLQQVNQMHELRVANQNMAHQRAMSTTKEYYELLSWFELNEGIPVTPLTLGNVLSSRRRLVELETSLLVASGEIANPVCHAVQIHKLIWPKLVVIFEREIAIHRALLEEVQDREFLEIQLKQVEEQINYFEAELASKHE